MSAKSSGASVVYAADSFITFVDTRKNEDEDRFENFVIGKVSVNFNLPIGSGYDKYLTDHFGGLFNYILFRF